MASKYIQKFPIPQDFPNILHDLAKEILRYQPDDIVEFCALYFKCLQEGKELDYTKKGQNIPCDFKNVTPGVKSNKERSQPQDKSNLQNAVLKASKLSDMKTPVDEIDPYKSKNFENKKNKEENDTNLLGLKNDAARTHELQQQHEPNKNESGDNLVGHESGDNLNIEDEDNNEILNSNNHKTKNSINSHKKEEFKKVSKNFMDELFDEADAKN